MISGSELGFGMGTEVEFHDPSQGRDSESGAELRSSFETGVGSGLGFEIRGQGRVSGRGLKLGFEIGNGFLYHNWE